MSLCVSMCVVDIAKCSNKIKQNEQNDKNEKKKKEKKKNEKRSEILSIVINELARVAHFEVRDT